MSRLIDELRKVANSVETIPARHISHLAADRIEELEAERDAWKHGRIQRIEELEAQLATEEAAHLKAIHTSQFISNVLDEAKTSLSIAESFIDDEHLPAYQQAILNREKTE